MDLFGLALSLLMGPPRDLRKERPIPSVARALVRLPDPSDHRAGLVDEARSHLGVPYVWGGTTADGFDCSGYIQTVFGEQGLDLPRMADEQFEATVPVAREAMEPGDLVFFETYLPGPSHAGIYQGDGTFVHASSGAGEVTSTELDQPYYAERFLGARRHPALR